MNKFIISPAKKEDSDFIAEGVMTAVGEEICEDLSKNLLPDIGTVKTLFSNIASMENSQYSYRNALIAHDKDGNRAGVIVAYDGADLHELRQPFVDAYNKMCGTQFQESDFDDETSDDEIYIDTLMVGKKYRNQGLGGELIRAIEKKYAGQPKPIGLLVDYQNPGAFQLYEKMGFSRVDDRKFCGVEMRHMKKQK